MYVFFVLKVTVEESSHVVLQKASQVFEENSQRKTTSKNSLISFTARACQTEGKKKNGSLLIDAHLSSVRESTWDYWRSIKTMYCVLETIIGSRHISKFSKKRSATSFCLIK